MASMGVITDRDGRVYRLRPIRPADAPALQRAFAKMDADDRRARLFAPTKELSDAMALAFCTIEDPDDLCVVLESDAFAGELLGGYRLMADPSGDGAEFAVSLQSHLQGRGLGRALMERLLEAARERGVARVWGTILADNAPMVQLARKLGFAISRDPDDPQLVKAVWSAV